MSANARELTAFLAMHTRGVVRRVGARQKLSSPTTIALCAGSLLLAGCDDRSGAFTLYRNSPADAGMRVHIATFDAKDGDAYNRENCELAAKLFRSQPGVTVRFWCEKGRYRP